MDEVTPIDSRKAVVRRGKRSPSKAETWELANKAYQLRIGGMSPTEIGKELGIGGSDEVIRMIMERYAYDASYLSSLDRQSMLFLEITRLDALQSAVWPSAMMGDPKSVDSAVKIISARAKIAGLEQVDPIVQKNLVLVMGEREEDYIAALKATGATATGQD
jgi:hypothetical protein